MTLRCHFCEHEIDPRIQTVWRQVTGWERKATSSSTRKGGSDIVLRERGERVACASCIDSAKRGVGPFQESLGV